MLSGQFVLKTAVIKGKTLESALFISQKISLELLHPIKFDAKTVQDRKAAWLWFLLTLFTISEPSTMLVRGFENQSLNCAWLANT